MYNLLVGFYDNSATGSRVFEHTDQALVDYVRPAGTLDVNRVLSFPALVMPEIGDSNAPPVARVGRITSLQRIGADYRFTFVQNPGLPALSTGRVASLATELGIGQWELNRTHWAIKDLDLYEVLLAAEGTRHLAPQVFSFPVEAPVEPDLVAVMMPFGAEFNPVYAAIKESVEGLGLRCHRADDIWENHHIMDDVISLIWRCRLVVSDLTSKNANVFYETGVAHSLGRDVIQIAQSMDDVPFDLRSIRTLTYLRNGEGLAGLKQSLAARTQTLLA